MNEQPVKTSGADVLSSRKKTEKNRMGGGIHPRLYVRGLSYTQYIFLLKLNEKEKFEKRNFWPGKNQENSFVTSHVTWFA